MAFAVLFLASLAVGLVHAFGGAPVYGSQRAVGSLIACVLFSVVAFLLWPMERREGAEEADGFGALADSGSRADFIAGIAASRLGVPGDGFDLLLTADLGHSPGEIMDLWEELAGEFHIDLSGDDYPEVNSIGELRRRLGIPRPDPE